MDTFDRGSSDVGQNEQRALPTRFLLVCAVLCASFLMVLLASVVSDYIAPLTLKVRGGVEKQDYHAGNTIFSGYGDEVCVFLSLAGKKSTLITKPMTVGELLDSYEIYPDENDELNYDRETMLFNGMELDYVQIETDTIVLYDTLPRRTETYEVQTIPKDFTEVICEGSDGEIRREIYQVIADGVVRSEEVISETVVTPSVSRVQRTGVGGTFVGTDGKTYSYSYYVDGTATAYGGPEFSGNTATGVQVEIGMIAVDPDTIPLKSTVYVDCEYPGISGIYHAEDTGGAVVDNVIDIYFGLDFAPMYAFGRRNVRVYVHAEPVA